MSSLRRRSLLDTQGTPQQRPLLKRVAEVDLFPKPKEDYARTQSRHGAIVSLVTVVLIGLLLLREILSYTLGWNAYRTELSVDTSLSKEVDFNLDITFPKVPCHELSLDVLDVTGTFRMNVSRNLFKTPVNDRGDLVFHGDRHGIDKVGVSNYDFKNDPNSPHFCGRCFIGKEPASIGRDQKPCCNTCEDVLNAHEKHGLPKPEKTEVEQCIYELSLANPGCNIQGTLNLKKVSGKLLFAPKRVDGGFKIQDVMRFDSSHTINKLSIGDKRVARFSRRGVHYPLNGHSFEAGKRFAEVRYFLKIVPTMYIASKHSNAMSATYEYGVQWTHRYIPIGFGHLPAVSLGFEFQPIQVNNYFERSSFYHFLVQLCGIVGGLFVILGLVDSLVVWIERHL